MTGEPASQTRWVIEAWEEPIRPGRPGEWVVPPGGIFAAEAEARETLARLRAAGRRVRLVRRETAVVEGG